MSMPTPQEWADALVRVRDDATETGKFEGRQAERAAVVKYLRNASAKLRGVPLHGYAMRVLNEEADAIERGEHVP